MRRFYQFAHTQRLRVQGRDKRNDSGRLEFRLFLLCFLHLPVDTVSALLAHVHVSIQAGVFAAVVFV